MKQKHKAKIIYRILFVFALLISAVCLVSICTMAFNYQASLNTTLNASFLGMLELFFDFDGDIAPASLPTSSPSVVTTQPVPSAFTPAPNVSAYLPVSSISEESSVLNTSTHSISPKLKGYDSKNNSYTYIQLGEYKDEPILWRILEINNNEVYLFSERIIEVMDFDENCNDWESSNIKTWLNGPFLEDSFTGHDSSFIITKPGLTSVFLISKSDLLKPVYGFSGNEHTNDPNRAATISTFVRNAYSSIINDNNGKLIYYTRDISSSKNSTSLAAIRSTGDIGSARYDRTTTRDGVGIRPAIYVNSDKLSFTKGNGTLKDPYR